RYTRHRTIVCASSGLIPLPGWTRMRSTYICQWDGLDTRASARRSSGWQREHLCAARLHEARTSVGSWDSPSVRSSGPVRTGAPLHAASTSSQALILTGTLGDPVVDQRPLGVGQERRSVERHARAERRALADLLHDDALARLAREGGGGAPPPPARAPRAAPPVGQARHLPAD